MDIVYLILGLGLLVGAGDALVKGAVSLSLRFGIPAIIVSATVVAFGTSAPELLISVEAAIKGAPDIALGNVVGSNIANVLLVLGVPAVIAPIAACGTDAHRNLYFMVIATVVFAALTALGVIAWWGGVILIVITLLMIADAVRVGLASSTAGIEVDLEDGDPDMPPWKIAAFLLAGMIGLPLGASLLIDGARGIALSLGVSEAVIGLTLVALGTSLPELATTVIAAMKRQTDVVIGSVIGSNIFNVTAVIGAAAVITPLQVPAELLNRDLWVMLFASAVLVPFVLFCWPIGRTTGAAFLAGYVGYIYFAFF